MRFVLPNAAGSGVDAITRAAQPALSKALGAPVVVENQTGAGGVLGLQTLARSAPDGTTLSVVSNNVVIFPSVYKSLPFDMPGDFTPIDRTGPPEGPRDVYAFVIHEGKVRAPAAAMEFIKRVDPGFRSQ